MPLLDDMIIGEIDELFVRSDDVKVYTVALDAAQVMEMMEEDVVAQAVSPGSRAIATWGSVKN